MKDYRLDYMKMEFKPFYINTSRGEAKEVRLEVCINGQRTTLQNVLDIEGINPTESEIDYYMRKFTEQLKYELNKRKE